MALILITGISGSGKSTVARELVNRNFTAYCTDESNISRWIDNDSGKEIEPPPRDTWKSKLFQSRHSWHFSPERLAKLLDESSSSPTFICGTAGNDGEVWHLFTKVIYLILDEQTLRRRIALRTNNDYGKEPHELAAILNSLKTARETYSRFGAIIIDASRPIEQVMDEILAVSLSN